MALTIALSGCASTGADDPKAEASASASAAAGFLSAYGMAGQDAVGIIDTLDRLTEEQRPTAFTASIEPDRLVLADAAGKVAGPQVLVIDSPEFVIYMWLLSIDTM
ncbi:hypothetical protein KCW65_22270, partial [Mycobacterium tuberculosis]|nr:hypothetical protein [Mycobacterium tuberculosis]